MKKWIAEALVFALSISSQAALHGETDSHFPESGKQIVQEVETAYYRGEYDSFLSSLHEQYQNAGKAGALRGVFESAKNAIKASPENVEEAIAKSKEKIKKLDKERNQRLLDAIAENPDLAIVQRVDAVAFHSLDDEDTTLMRDLEALKFHIPETAEGTLENKVSALETEYYIKSLLLDIAAHHGKLVTDNTKKKIALVLEKLSKMENAAKEISSVEWKEKFAKAKKAFLAEKAYQVDLNTLNELATGNIVAENSVEQKVKEIMMEYQQQKQGITPSSELAQN